MGVSRLGDRCEFHFSGGTLIDPNTWAARPKGVPPLLLVRPLIDTLPMLLAAMLLSEKPALILTLLIASLVTKSPVVGSVTMPKATPAKRSLPVMAAAVTEQM